MRRIAVGCGLAAAIGGHFANDVLLPWLGQQVHSWVHTGPSLDMLLVQPLLLAVLQGPFVLMYVLLLRRGTRLEARSIAQSLQAEAASGQGAVTATEVPILLSPARRFWVQVTVLRRHGFAAYRSLLRLQTMQYELATSHAQPVDGHTGAPLPSDELRGRIHRARVEVRTTVGGSARPAEVLA